MKVACNEVVAASCVWVGALDVERPTARAACNTRRVLSCFSIVRRLDGQPFPPGKIIVTFHLMYA